MIRALTRAFEYGVYISLSLLLLFASANCWAKWQLEKSSDDISVYTESVSGSAFKAYRGIMEVPFAPVEVLAVLGDFSHMCSWLYRCAEVKKIAGPKGHTFIYFVMNSPWPLSPRDVVMAMFQLSVVSSNDVQFFPVALLP